MYPEKLPIDPFTTTIVKIIYDCCGKEHQLKWKDADKNFKKNGGKHICRPCMLKDNNPASKPEVREKMRQTCLEKYGVTCVLNTPENMATRLDEMFGTPERTQKIVDARKETFREIYGVDHPMLDEGVKNTCLDRYGVDVPLKSPEILAKMVTTLYERYGVDNVMKDNAVVQKVQDTTEERYGVRHYNELPEMKEYLREHCKEWLAESYANHVGEGNN